MTRDFKISVQMLKDLKSILHKDSPRENASFVLIGENKQNEQISYLARRIIEIPENLFKIKNEYHIELIPKGINGIVRLCEVNNLGLAVTHCHPLADHASLRYSPSDDYGEARLSKYFHEILPDKPFISILFGKDTVIGRVWEDGNRTRKIDDLISLGSILKKYNLKQTSETFTDVDLKYNRQISAIGKEGQRKLQETKVGIVGVGGTGSIVAEQLVRLGVRDIKIIDFDKFEESNLTRMYGSYHENLFWFNSHVLPRSSKYKVSIIGQNLKRINPKLKLSCINKNIVLTDTVKDILDRDVIFSCTDEHWGRSIINQICYQYLIPTINTGVRITTENDQFKAGTIVSHLLIPDKPCLWCSEYLNASRIYAESTSKEEREKLANEGYIENIDDKAPSVITFTSLGSSISMMIFLNLITGYLGDYGEFSTLRFDMKMVDLRRGKALVKQDCVCRKVLGRGDFANLFTINELPEL